MLLPPEPNKFTRSELYFESNAKKTQIEAIKHTRNFFEAHNFSPSLLLSTVRYSFTVCHDASITSHKRGHRRLVSFFYFIYFVLRPRKAYHENAEKADSSSTVGCFFENCTKFISRFRLTHHSTVQLFCFFLLRFSVFCVCFCWPRKRTFLLASSPNLHK